MISFRKSNEHSLSLNVSSGFLNLTSKGSPFLTFISSMRMDTSFGSITRLIIATFTVFVSLQRSEAFQWGKKPANPTNVVEGVNSDRVLLVWEFVLERDETIGSIQIQREGPGSKLQIIATKLGSDPFDVKEPFKTKYKAFTPLTLELLDVKNNEEYRYIVSVLSTKDSKVYEVRINVNVPPQITRPPVSSLWNPRFKAGENWTLTCNATGDPLPNITWTREGFRPDQFNASGHVLHFVNVQRKDIGSYKCTASNGYGKNATKLANVNINCDGQCEPQTVGITIKNEWKDAFRNQVSTEYKELATNLISAIVSLYSQPENEGKQLYEVAFDRPPSRGSIKTAIQLQFRRGVSDPLQPLREQVNKGQLGIYKVNDTLVLNPTDPPTSSPTGETTTASKQPPSVGARSGLTDAEMWGIIGACIAFAIVIIIIIIVCCIKKRQKQGGAVKSKYTEADGYRMNRQPPPSGLGTASPAYVEARMYAPANATKKQDDQQKPLNYADLSFDKSGKPPPRYGSGTEYSEMSPEKRPPPAGGQGGGGQGEGGFELWC